MLLVPVVAPEVSDIQVGEGELMTDSVVVASVAGAAALLGSSVVPLLTGLVNHKLERSIRISDLERSRGVRLEEVGVDFLGMIDKLYQEVFSRFLKGEPTSPAELLGVVFSIDNARSGVNLWGTPQLRASAHDLGQALIDAAMSRAKPTDYSGQPDKTPIIPMLEARKEYVIQLRSTIGIPLADVYSRDQEGHNDSVNV